MQRWSKLLLLSHPQLRLSAEALSNLFPLYLILFLYSPAPAHSPLLHPPPPLSLFYLQHPAFLPPLGGDLFCLELSTLPITLEQRRFRPAAGGIMTSGLLVAANQKARRA